MATTLSETKGNEFTRAGAQLRDQWVSGLRRLGQRNASTVVLYVLLGYAVLGDFITTSVMMHTGVSEEGNGYALAVMNVIGVIPAVALLSLVAGALIVGGFDKSAPTPYGVVLRVVGIVVLLAKIVVVTENIALWTDTELLFTIPWPWTW